MFNKGEYIEYLEPTIEDIEEEKIYTLELIQIPIQQTVWQPNKWWQNKSNQTPLSHHAINSNQVLKLSYWRNTHLNLHKMKPPLEQHLTEMMIDIGTSEPVSQNPTQSPWNTTNGWRMK